MGKNQFLILTLLTAFVLSGTSTFADDANVLPEGRFRLRLVSTYTTAENELNSSGSSTSLGDAYSTSLNSRILSAINPKTQALITALNSVQPGLGDNLNVAELGMDLKSNIVANVLALEYGAASWLSLGVIVPIVYGEVEAIASTTPDSNFQTFKNSLPDGHPLKTQLSGLAQQMSVDGLNQILRTQFNYSAGLESWSGYGLGDVEIGAKANYYFSHPLKMTLKGGVRLPTGRTDDPDQLFDLGFGDGQFDLAAYHLMNFYPLPYLTLTWDLGYTAQLPDNVDARVPLSSSLPVSATKVNLDRDLGDFWENQFEVNINFGKYIELTPKYFFKQKFSDSYSNASINTSALESDTDQIIHRGRVDLGYNNLHDIRAGTATIPYDISAFYQHPFGGRNVTQAKTTGITLKTYF